MLARIILLGSLYLAQGLPYGFFTQALPVLLRKSGMSLPLISLANVLAAPWILKFLWAPAIDRVPAPSRGRRRVVIIPLQLASVAVLAALAFAGSAELIWPLFVAVLLINLLAATQDIATDGLAVEILGPHERGLGNGLQVGAYRTGMIIGGGLMLLVFAYSGWVAAFLGLAGILFLTTIPILVFREPVTEPAPSEQTSFAAIRESLERPGMWPWLLVPMTFKVGEWFATAMLRTFLTDAKLGLDDIALMLGIVGFTAAVLGALAGGALTTRLGRHRALVVFGTLQTIAIASFALASLYPSTPMFYVVTVAEHVTSAMATAALFTAMMDRCRPSHAGIDYTVQASVVLVLTAVSSMLAGLSAQALGYSAHFLAAAGLSLLGVLIAGRVGGTLKA